MDDTLCAVDHSNGAMGLSQGQQLVERLPGAEHVGQLTDGQQTGAWADQALCGVQVDMAGGIQRQHHQAQAPALCQLLPRQQIGVVFQGADHQLIALVKMLLQPIGQQVERLGGAAGKDDFVAACGIQPGGDSLSCRLKRSGRPFAGQVLGTVHIGGAAGVIAEQGIQHGLRFLAGGSAVEIGLAVGQQGGQSREVRTPGGGQ